MHGQDGPSHNEDRYQPRAASASQPKTLKTYACARDYGQATATGDMPGQSVSIQLTGINGLGLVPNTSGGAWTLSDTTLITGNLNGHLPNFSVFGTDTFSYTGQFAFQSDQLSGKVTWERGTVTTDQAQPTLIGTLAITTLSGSPAFTSSFSSSQAEIRLNFSFELGIEVVQLD